MKWWLRKDKNCYEEWEQELNFENGFLKERGHLEHQFGTSIVCSQQDMKKIGINKKRNMNQQEETGLKVGHSTNICEVGNTHIKLILRNSRLVSKNKIRY